MAYSLGNHLGVSLGANGGTTGNLNTSGADLIIIAVSQFSGQSAASLSDNQGNSYTALTARTGGESEITLYYKQNPTTSATHTFTLGGASNQFSSIAVAAFTGSVSSPFDAENGNGSGSGVTSLGSNSITLAETNELTIVAISVGSGGFGGTPTASGLTVIESVNYIGSTSEGVALAWGVDVTSTTWNWSGSAVASVAIAAFKDTPGGGGPAARPFWTNLGARRIA